MKTILKTIGGRFINTVFQVKQYVKDFSRGTLIEQSRSNDWEEVSSRYLSKHSHCAYCDTSTGLVVHHIIPYHIDPTEELNTNNLITLCESNNNCHLKHGHLGNWKGFNPQICNECKFNE